LSGLGWYLSVPDINVSFKASIQNFPSSLKSEGAAILTALAPLPPNSTITIYTDSLNAIRKIESPFLPSLRQQYKSPCYLIWKLIKHVITSNNLNLILLHIKGHSDSTGNARADSLAKEGAQCQDYQLNLSPHSLSEHSISFNTITLDDNLRSLAKITCSNLSWIIHLNNPQNLLINHLCVLDKAIDVLSSASWTNFLSDSNLI